MSRRKDYFFSMRSPCLLVLFSILSSDVAAQDVLNGGFSDRCDSCASGVAHWQRSWASKGVTMAAEEGALHIESRDSAGGVGFAEQAIVVSAVPGTTIITLSARIRTRDMSKQGAGLNIACYAADGAFLSNKDPGLFWYSWVQGTRPWSDQVLKTILPEGTATVKIGAIVKGTGEAWFDDVRMTLSGIEGRQPDGTAKAYIGAALDTIRRHALHRDSVDLEALRSTALRIAGSSGDPADRHLAVEYLLQGLGDRHSFLMKPEEFRSWQGEGGRMPITYASHRVIEGYGYLMIPGFMNGDSLDIQAFADSLQGAIRWLSTQDIRGWIVDLRQNTGGNMAPMVCGLGPLLEPGVLGTLTHIDGRIERWFYRDGEYGWDGVPLMHAIAPVRLEKKLPIAVFIAQATGSSGECTAISFIGNPRTRSFGQPTFGLTTGNGQFALPDGAQMFLASTIMGDRNGRLFHGPLLPDEQVDQPADWKYDATLDAGLTWLKAQH